MCCAEALVKILLYLFNLVFFLCGAVLFGVGIWLLVEDQGIALIDNLGIPSIDGSGQIWRVAVYLLIGIGVFVFLVGFIGCIGVKSKNKCLVFFFVSLLLLVLVAEITAGIMVVVYKQKIDDTVSNEMSMDLRGKYRWENATSHTDMDQVSYTWNYMQYQFKCCGSNGYKDFRGTEFANMTGFTVPFECCVTKEDGKLKESDIKDLNTCREAAKKNEITVNDAQFLHPEGCYTVIKDWIDTQAIIIMAAGFSFAAIQILGILLGCCLTNLWGKDA